MKIEDVEGIGPAFAGKLTAAGVATTDALLERGANPAGRDRLSRGDRDLRAAPARVGQPRRPDADRRRRLRNTPTCSRPPASIRAPSSPSGTRPTSRSTFQELDAARPNTVRQVPSEATIAGWIEQANKLPKVVSH